MITISQVPVGATVQIDGEKFQYSGQAMLKFKGMKTSVYVFKDKDNPAKQRVFPVSKTLTFGKVGDKYIMVVGKSIEYD